MNDKYLLALHQIPKCTSPRLFKIWQGSHDFAYVWEKASQKDFVSWGIEAEAASEIIALRHTFDPDGLFAKADKLGIQLISWDSKDYPVLLKEIPDPPFLLYAMGSAALLSQTCIAVVGTRLMSPYGKQVIQQIVPTLVQAGLVIVSGLAVGVDAQAHKVTLEHQGRAVAVLGSGIDTIYPSHNKKLAADIVAHDGVVLSEFPLGMQPTNYSFPIRNRIISGLSKGTLVIEAKEESGSLITAHLALEQNRDVFTVPGSIFASNSQGVHRLIRSGEASLITSGEDILSDWGLLELQAKEQTGPLRFEDPMEEQMYHLLSREPQLIDVLIEQSHLASSQVNGILTVLEMKGLAQNLGGMRWVRK